MLNEAADAITAIEPGTPGRVRVRGEIWRAISNVRLEPGEHVRITNVEGLTLTVRKE
jgi:membrane protein implicated in regulation of membrane protease activity